MHLTDTTDPTPNAQAFGRKIAQRRSVPGVLSFTASMQLLYMNAEAERLSQEIGHAAHDNAAPGLLPTEIAGLCAELEKEFRQHPNPEEWESLELRRVTGDVKFPVLLRGFLLPDSAGIEQCRFLILMERIGRRNETIPSQVKARFGLTNREHEIIMCLAEGRTNKEISATLEITENTVKEHLKHVMRKTKSKTRTAILAKIFRSS